jgi:AI-2 transport protein TqsA
MGVFLAVPLTMSLIIALDSSPQTRPVALLLGPEVTEQPKPEEAPAAGVATDHGQGPHLEKGAE